MFNEGAGLRANDLSGNGNHGTLTNFEPFSATSGWTGGKFGTALRFDGVNDCVLTSLDLSSDAFTLSCWINSQYIASADNIRGILNKREGVFEWRLTQTDAKTLKFVAQDDAAGITMSTTGVTPLTNGLGYHVVLTYNGINTKLFINGNLDAIGSGNPIRNTASTVVIGRDATFAARYFIGTIDNVCIYNRELSAQEVPQLSAQPFSMFRWNPKNALFKARGKHG